MTAESFLYPILFFALSLVGSIGGISLLIGFANKNNLLDQPNQRSSHQVPVPRIGGVVFFVALALCLLLAKNELDSSKVQLILLGAFLLFMVGLYDDISSVKPRLKFLAQIIALLLLTFTFQGTIEQFRIHTIFSCIHSSVFLMLVFCFFLVAINAINLIDGINGLAALISLNFFVVMGFLFYPSFGHFSILSWVLMGSLIAFLCFNFSKRRKIFMGDCGSLLLGFLMCSFSLQLMEATNPYNDTLALSGNQATIILCSLFSLPVFDLLRVMCIRLTNGKHIFHADRNHLHHYLTDKLGKSHLVAALTLFLIHLSIIMIAFIWVY